MRTRTKCSSCKQKNGRKMSPQYNYRDRQTDAGHDDFFPSFSASQLDFVRSELMSCWADKCGAKFDGVCKK